MGDITVSNCTYASVYGAALSPLKTLVTLPDDSRSLPAGKTVVIFFIFAGSRRAETSSLHHTINNAQYARKGGIPLVMAFYSVFTFQLCCSLKWEQWSSRASQSAGQTGLWPVLTVRLSIRSPKVFTIKIYNQILRNIVIVIRH